MVRITCWAIAIGVLASLLVVVPSYGQSTGSGGIQMSAMATGMRRLSPGAWSAVNVQGVNRTAAESTETISVYFDKESQLQFARRLWLPPMSMRTTWLPVKAPRKTTENAKSFRMTSLPLTGDSGNEVVRRRYNQELLTNVLVAADTEPLKTAAVFRNSPVNDDGVSLDIDFDAYEMMAAARELAEYSRIIIELSGDFLPPNPTMWESLDHFILSGDRILDDSAGLAAMRDWLFRGGRLCVFVDRTSPETVSAILGHSQHYRVIDRVELDEFTIREVGTVPGHDTTDRRRFETPVELVRVAAEHADVQCWIDDWPAAFWLPAGEGEVLFLTLAPNGWRQAPILAGWESLPENRDTAFRGLNALKAVAGRFYVSRFRDPKLNAAVAPVLQEQIGYRIPGRALATGLLGANTLGLILGGIWLARRNQLDRLAILLPLIAGSTTVAFVAVGSANNRSVPTSVAYTQLVRFRSDVDSVQVLGSTAMYQQQDQPLRASAGTNGLLIPATAPPEGSTHRLIWDDSNRGEWANVSLAAGSVQFASYEQTLPVAEHVVARGSFDAQGLRGVVEGVNLARQPDAIVSAIPAAMAVAQCKPDGSFRVTPGDVLARDQFLADTVVSDTSRRHQEVYRGLLVQRDDCRFASRPTLLAWIEPHHSVLRIPDDIAQSGSALAAIPLSLERTPPATEFTIPATFIRVAAAAGLQGLSLAYDNRTGRWLSDSSRSTNTRLRFALPREVFPCRLTEAKLSIRLDAPSRELQVLAVVDNKDVLIRSIPNPIGVYEIVVTQPEWLSLDANGGLRFGIVITESEQEKAQKAAYLQPMESTAGEGRNAEPPVDDQSHRPTSFTTWGIDYVRLTVRGITGEQP